MVQNCGIMGQECRDLPRSDIPVAVSVKEVLQLELSERELKFPVGIDIGSAITATGSGL